MRKFSIALLLLAAAATLHAEPAKIRFDHLWIVVSQGAPERAALEKAGFRIAPGLSRHDGQGTASISAEFLNGYLELIWVEPTVRLIPELQRGAEKFRKRAEWRTSGWSPFGLNFVRATKEEPVFPFPTWSITAPWMDPGESIVILIPRDDTTSPSLSLHANPTDEAKNAASGDPMFQHPNGARRITKVRLIAPRAYQPAPAVTYVKDAGLIAFGRGKQWLVELTFDQGAQKKVKDLRPDLPLLVRY